MRYSDCWNTGGMSVFLLQDELPHLWLGYVRIQSVEWKPKYKDTCLYCGEYAAGSRCHSCGSSLTEGNNKLGKANITLGGFLPQARKIFWLPKGSTIDVLYKERRRRDLYWIEELAFRFRNCEIVSRYIPDLVSNEPELVTLFVIIECDVEMYPDGLREETSEDYEGEKNE